MKILLSNPPWVTDGRHGVRAGSRWPHLKIPEEEDYLPYPFFLGYATSLLKKHNFDVKAIDAIAEGISYEDFFKRVKEYNPDIIFAEVSTPSLQNDLHILKQIKTISKAKLIIAGPDMDIFDESFMLENRFIDFAIMGEYEFTLLELVEKIGSKDSLKNVAGLVFKEKKKVYKNQKRALTSLEGYPWPDREEFPSYKYHDCPGGIPRPSAQMISSRGCPYLCTFCAWPQLVYGGRNYRTREVKDVVDEMEFLVKKKGFKSVYFDDDTFNIGKKRMLELAYELKKRNWRTPWAFMGRSDLVDEEILKNFKEVGLAAVKYGVESGVQEIVNNAEKNLDLKIATRNMLLTKKLGIKMHLTFTFGLPGETKETITKTVNYAIYIDPESVQFSIMTPFPGTRFYETLKKDGMLATENLSNYDGNTMSVIRTKELSPEELTNAQRYAYQRWHQHKRTKGRYRTISPPKLFLNCIKEHGFAYTIRHTFNYIKKKRYLLYKNN
jgi:radical SAM superfamily enzyme YgiQ (UPF0313 family)